MPIDSIRRRQSAPVAPAVAPPREPVSVSPTNALPPPRRRISFVVPRAVRRSAAILLPIALLLGAVGGGSPQALALIGQNRGGGPTQSGHQLRQPAAVTNGLVAWYPLDGDAKDYSGNDNFGTVTGSPTYQIGRYDKAINFIAPNQYVTSQTVPYSSTSDWSISSWVYLRADSRGIIGYNGDGGNNGYGLFVSDGFGNSGHVVTVLTGGQQYSAVGTGVSLNANTWYHIVAESSGTTWSLYANGILISSAGSVSAASPTGSFVIGSSLDGMVDDVRMYNRALSSNEIQQLYAGSPPTNCDQTCVGWWKLDEASGTTAADSSGTGNTATLSNFSFNGINGWTSGVFKNGLLLNSGASTYAATGTFTGLSNLTDPQTLSAWFKTTSNSRIDLLTLGDNSTQNTQLLLDGGMPQVAEYGGSALVSSSVNLADGAWHLLTYTWNGSLGGSINKLYADGKLLDTETGSPQSLSSFQAWIGTYGSGEYFDGSLDDVRVYNRALEDYEVYAQYAAGRSS